MNPITRLQLCFAALARRVNNLDPGDLYLRPSAGDVTVSSDTDTFLQGANNAAMRTALGLGTGDSPTFAALTLTSTTDQLLKLNSLTYLGTDTNQVYIYASNFGNALVSFNNGSALSMRSDYGLAWSGTLSAAASPDLFLFRGAANTLYQRNGTNAQTFLLANTYTDASNYERGVFGFTSNVLRIGTENAGTGSARAIDFVTSNSVRWEISTAGHLMPGGDILYQLGSGASRVSSIWGLQFFGTAFSTYAALGPILLTDGSGSDFGRLQFGGTTSSFPALKRSAANLQARLADDSAFTNIQGKITTDTAYAAGAIVPTGYLTLFDSTGTAYQVPCIAA